MAADIPTRKASMDFALRMRSYQTSTDLILAADQIYFFLIRDLAVPILPDNLPFKPDAGGGGA